LARDVAEIKMVVKDILNILTAKTSSCIKASHRPNESGDNRNLLQHLPLKSVEEVTLFDGLISTNEEKQKLVST
jgi:hypothetical protein